jgi:serine phosphatase RsbU (regulator of sigma subunit)
MLAGSVARLGVANDSLQIENEERKCAEAAMEEYADDVRRKNDRFEADLRLAREIQLALLPQKFPTFPHDAAEVASALRFSVSYHPAATVGGDFYHVLQISDSVAGVFICDVMGHDVRAALVSAVLRTLVEELKSTAGDAAWFLTEVNQRLIEILGRTEAPIFATAFYAVLDIENGRVQYASAGHPRPLHLHADSGVVECLPFVGCEEGPALGVVPDIAYGSCVRPLHPRDLLVFYTDGLYEVRNAQTGEYGEEHLLQAAQRQLGFPPAMVIDALILDALRYAHEEAFEDDVCLVAAQVATCGGCNADSNGHGRAQAQTLSVDGRFGVLPAPVSLGQGEVVTRQRS